jgi:hypothetical protein
VIFSLERKSHDNKFPNNKWGMGKETCIMTLNPSIKGWIKFSFDGASKGKPTLAYVGRAFKDQQDYVMGVLAKILEIKITNQA